MTAAKKQEMEKLAPPKTEMEMVRHDFQRMEHQFKAALPAHIPVERFMRVVITALQSNPTLLQSDRRSLYAATMKCAQDGLLPDGREAAFVPFKGMVQYMPMVAGILKKVRNSGELLTISAHIAYENDTFLYRLGDDERIEHAPLLNGDRGKPKLVYAIAHTKGGGVYREVMTVADIEKIRAVSRAKDNGPWVGWWDEMARKTVIRRLSKYLPMSTDLDDLIRRDDELYDFAGAREAGKKAKEPSAAIGPVETRQALEHFASGETIDATDEVSAKQMDEERAEQEGREAEQHKQQAEPTTAKGAFAEAQPDPIALAGQRGWEARKAGQSRKAIPGEYREPSRNPECTAWLSGWTRCDDAINEEAKRAN